MKIQKCVIGCSPQIFVVVPSIKAFILIVRRRAKNVEYFKQLQKKNGCGRLNFISLKIRVGRKYFCVHAIYENLHQSGGFKLYNTKNPIDIQ